MKIKLNFVIFLAVLGLSLQVNSFADQTLTGHVPPDINNSKILYHANQSISSQIVMPLANQSQLSTLLQNLYNPKSPLFHQFLTPAQFNQQFAPSSIDVTDVQEYLAKYGISSAATANAGILNVTGSVSAFEQAFGFKINYYQRNSDGLVFFAPNANPVIPQTLAGKILAVGGLDNLPKYMAQRQQSPMTVSSKAAVSGPPSGSLTPSYVKTAYNLNSVPATGSGQTVALFELDGYKASDIETFLSYFQYSSNELNNITNPCNYLSPVPPANTPRSPVNFATAPNSTCSVSNILQNVLIDGFSGVPNYGSNGAADEVTLDAELVTAFAPGSSHVLVYEAANTNSGWIDEWQQIATDNKAKIISCSYGEPEQDSPTLNSDYNIFQEMAAQGQAVFVASGDSGAYCAGGKTLCVDEPASQPFVTAVGISALKTNNGAYSSESASVYGGGGTSAYWSIPSFQTTAAAQAVSAAKVSKTMRNVPDVVLTADSSTAYAFYIDGSWAAYYGSSISSPIWASFISLVNQGLGANAPVGSVNSALYQLAQSSSYASDFHDITTGTNGYYPAETGFDDATGLGSFNGLSLYDDLVKVSLPVTAPPAPTGLSATAGNASVSVSWTGSLGASSYDVKRSSSSSGTYTTIASLVLNTSYTDTSVSNGTTYYYVVSAVNAAGQSANSAPPVSATPVLPVSSAPGSLKAVAGNAQVALSWSGSSLATSYNVKRSTSSTGTFTTVSKSGSVTSTSYTDTGLTNGTTYYYVVSAVNASGESANSAPPVSATPSTTSVVAAVTNLTGVVSSYWGQPAILLQWTQSSSSKIVRNNVYRSTGSGTPVYYGSTPALSGAYDIGVNYSTTYNYYVTAVNSSGVESPASNKITVTMPAAPKHYLF